MLQLAESSRCTRGTLRIARLGVVDYQRALALQQSLVGARLTDRIGDTLLLLDHPHVFTLGRGADERFILNSGDVPVFRVSRGGQVTYHGPGQLVGYPIIKLDGHHRDVIRYLRMLEEVLIKALGRIGITAARRDGLTGVWVEDRKIASIGVGFRRWVSMHGFALNIATDLRYFDSIVPCGIEGCHVTSIRNEGKPATLSATAGIVADEFARVFDFPKTAVADPAEIWETGVEHQAAANR